MGRTPCCSKGVKKGPWTADEDAVLVSYISENGPGNWRSLPKLAGLVRCGKSCRLRWTNYLRPDIKRGSFTSEEEKLVIQLHAILGNKWAAIASQLSGRTDNEVKNLWNTHLKRRLRRMGIDPQTHEPLPTSGACSLIAGNTSTRHTTQWESARLQAEARLSRESLLHSLNTPVIKPDSSSDLFLRIWNSEVGESFRKIKSDVEATCLSSMSQASSRGWGSVCESEIRTQTEEIEKKVDVERGHRGDNVVGESDSSSSIGLEDSSELALQWLLDFPISNYMNFLGGSIDDYSSCLKD